MSGATPTPLPAHSVTGPPDAFTVDAEVLAPRLGLEVAALKREMRRGVVYSRVERGEGEDAGTWRITVTYRAQRVRFLVTEAGDVYALPAPQPAAPDAGPPLLALARRAAAPSR